MIIPTFKYNESTLLEVNNVENKRLKEASKCQKIISYYITIESKILKLLVKVLIVRRRIMLAEKMLIMKTATDKIRKIRRIFLNKMKKQKEGTSNRK